MTKAIVEIAAPLGISVHDHIIVGKNGHTRLEGAEADPVSKLHHCPGRDDLAVLVGRNSSKIATFVDRQGDDPPLVFLQREEPSWRRQHLQ